MSVLARLQKRQRVEIEIDGEKVLIAPLTYYDSSQLDLVSDDKMKVFYTLGRTILEEDGTPAFTRGESESPSDFAARVRDSLPDISVGTIKQLTESITKATKLPSVKAVEKNSDATDSPAS